MNLKYAPSEDRNGKPLQPGDKVRIKTYPIGTQEGIIEISSVTLQRLPDGTWAPALSVNCNGTLYGLPVAGAVIKINECAIRAEKNE